jgi:uncharacterized phage-associated protein
MTVSAHDVAAVLRERQPRIGKVQLHKLLYYCQGHHLGVFGVPLFNEEVYAWDMGPVVSRVWRDEERRELPAVQPIQDEAALNTIGYVLSRYGSLNSSDLMHMTHGEKPWQLANASRAPQGSVRIRREWLQDYFSTEGAPDADEDEVPLDSAAVSALVAEAAARPPGPGHRDSYEELQAWAANRG